MASRTHPTTTTPLPDLGRHVDLRRFADYPALLAEVGVELPAELSSVLAALALVQQEADAASAAAIDSDPAGRYVDDIVTAAVAGQPLPDASAFLALRSRHDSECHRAEALRDAEQRIAYRLSAAIATTAPAVLEDLRRVHADVVGEAREAVSALGPSHVDGTTVLAGGTPEELDAWRKLCVVSEKYDRVRSLHQRLVPGILGPPTPAEAMRFSEIKNVGDFVGPAEWNNAARPWPTDSVPRLAWLIRHDATLWVPGPEELTARWAEVYPRQAQE